ncbi:MAG: Mini-ribonuclease 3 [Huintestinicola sp.]
MEKREVNQYSPLTLAFLGDAVYGQLVREFLVLEANRPLGKLHKASVERVRACYQANAADSIAPMLTEDEAAVMKRGRNATGNSGNVPKNSNPIEYHKATGLEALFGYLHLCGAEDRLRELFQVIWDTVEVIK